MNTNPGNSNLKVICLHCEAMSETKEMHYSSGGEAPTARRRRRGDPIGSDFTALHLRVQLIFSPFPPQEIGKAEVKRRGNAESTQTCDRVDL